MNDLFSLAGRTALVTGGAGGLGRMIAAGLLAAGARVYLGGRSQTRCIAAARELSAEACVPLCADVGVAEGRARIIETIGAREGLLDILVNNAGAAHARPLGDVEEAAWDQVLSVNLKAPFFLTQACLPLLRAAVDAYDRPAKVINIASVDGLGVNVVESYAYQASKAALVQLTRRLAARLASERILVSGIAPGAFPSDMNRAARDDPSSWAPSIPVGRVGGRDDIAGAVVFLAGRGGDYVVGETLSVAGGCVRASPTHGWGFRQPAGRL